MISADSVSGGYLFGGQHCQDMSVDVKIILKWTLSSHNDLATHQKSLQNLACLYIRSLFPPTLFSVCFEVEPEKITKGKLLKAICRTSQLNKSWHEKSATATDLRELLCLCVLQSLWANGCAWVELTEDRCTWLHFHSDLLTLLSHFLYSAMLYIQSIFNMVWD